MTLELERERKSNTCEQLHIAILTPQQKHKHNMAEISSQATCAKQLSQLAEVDVIEFVDDTIHYLKGNRVAFLTKYSEAFGG